LDWDKLGRRKDAAAVYQQSTKAKPNNALQLTAYSLRSCVASASGSS
jgi:hypothetical protein